MAGWFMILQGISTAHAVMDILSVSLKTPLVLKVCVNMFLDNLFFLKYTPGQIIQTLPAVFLDVHYLKGIMFFFHRIFSVEKNPFDLRLTWLPSK